MVRIQNDVRCDLVIERVYATQAGMPPGKHPSFIEVTKGGENGCTAAIIRDSTFDGFWTDILGLSRDSVMEGNYHQLGTRRPAQLGLCAPWRCPADRHLIRESPDRLQYL